MLILGFQKMTLLDFPGHMAATVFTGGCNLRCPFCHNALLVTEIDPATAIGEEEIFSFLEKRKGLLDGVAVTGGEPLLQKDIVSFLSRVREMGYGIKLDTNGTFPEKLREVAERGLVDYVAMDIKNGPSRYAATVGVPDLDLSPVRESVSFLLSGGVDYEFRTTVVREFHDVSAIAEAAEWIAGARRYFLQGFVDSGNLIDGDMHGVPKEEMAKMREAAAVFVPETSLRGV